MSQPPAEDSKGSSDRRSVYVLPSVGQAAALSRPLGSIRPQAGPSNATNRAIGNAAIPNTAGAAASGTGVTRTGAPKMTFLPNHPMRRKATTPADVAPAEGSTPRATPAPATDRGRGRGRGAPGRGGPPPPAAAGRGQVNMVASGPFALGPAASGSSGQYRRPAVANQGTSIGLSGPTDSADLGAGLSHSAAPSLKQEKKVVEDEEEGVLSEEEGTEKVDMDRVGKLDWNAPVALKGKKEPVKKKGVKVKREEVEAGDAEMDGVDAVNALDLSESEEDEEVEDLLEYFTARNEGLNGQVLNSGGLFFFQFPSPFPRFTPVLDITSDAGLSTSNVSSKPEVKTEDSKGKGKSVSWAPDVKVEEGSQTPESKRRATDKPNGVIGQLEVYKSGAVKIRLGDNMLMDVTAATQPGFLQQAVHVDVKNRRMTALGEISQRFIVYPDVDRMLEELAGVLPGERKVEGLEGLEQLED